MKSMSIKSCFILLLSIALFSCKKFLEKSPDIKLSLISSGADLQALLDRSLHVNSRWPGALEVASDDYMLYEDAFNAFEDHIRRLITWQDGEQFAYSATGSGSNDWTYLYATVMMANVVLDYQPDSEPDFYEKQTIDQARGHAYFIRALAFLDALAIWSAAYDEATASDQPGVPLRLNSDPLASSSRASVKKGFEQVLSDTRAAIGLLPNQALHVMRPSRAAAYGLMARTLLYMRQYKEAGLYADSSLQIQNSLVDYNQTSGDVNPSAEYRFQPYNSEVLFHADHQLGSDEAGALFHFYGRLVDKELFNTYADGDKRKTLFFRELTAGDYYFAGSYTGGPALFFGLTTAEMLLIRAEAKVRDGQTASALADINRLLQHRWDPALFTPITNNNSQQLLEIILAERRKELVNRGLRWMDLKRFNAEGANISLRRTIGSSEYLLPVNSPRWLLQIPQTVIERSGISPNPR